MVRSSCRPAHEQMLFELWKNLGKINQTPSNELDGPVLGGETPSRRGTIDTISSHFVWFSPTRFCCRQLQEWTRHRVAGGLGFARCLSNVNYINGLEEMLQPIWELNCNSHPCVTSTLVLPGKRHHLRLAYSTHRGITREI